MSAGLLVVRRGGTLWGVPAAAVAAVERGPLGVAVRLAGGGELGGEAVVGLTGALPVRGLVAAVRRRLPAPAAGLAVWGSEPMVVVGVAPAGAGGAR